VKVVDCCISVVHKTILNSLAIDLHEQLLLNYGTLLMSHCSLWQVGISYLDYCSAEGCARIEVLLPTLPLGSEARALKIIQVARERDLHHIGKLMLQ
jgi:nuclear pore complex protein Nup85